MSSAPLAAAPDHGARIADGRVHRLRRSLHACTAEGLVAEVVSACAGGSILVAWAVYLDAGALVTGALLALSQLAQLFQLPAAWTTSWLGHRRACILLVGASRQAMLPLAALPLLPLSNEAQTVCLLSVAALSAVLGVLGNNAWVSWMSELVPQRVRGRYFGRRTALCTLGGALTAGAVGLLLDQARARGLTGYALASLQVLACLAGILTTTLMLRQHDPRPERERVPLRVARMLAPLADPRARGLLAYLAFWNGAVGLAGSYFALHMVRNLKMGFAVIALHGTALATVRMLAAPVWGRLVDRLGARPVLLACSFGISAVPFVWLFPREGFLWPLALDCLLAGVLWCGHGIAMFNLPLTIAPRRDRPFYLAAFATVSGLCFSGATLLGGLLAEALPERIDAFGASFHNLHVLFAASGLLRIGGALMSLRIEEPRAHGVSALWSALKRPRRGVARVAVAHVAGAANDNARRCDERVARDREPRANAS